MVIVHGPYDSPDVDRVMIVPSLPAHDPLLQHLALVLQTAVEGEGVAGQLYADSLADALVVHFLKRYAAARPSLRVVTGGLLPYKLRRTITYIQAHLDAGVIPDHARRRGADEPGPFCAPVQACHRAGAPSVRDHLPDGTREAVIARDRRAPHRHRSPGWVRGPKSLHRALSDARRPDPQSLPRPRQACMSGAARGTSSSAWTIVARFQHV